MRKTKIICTIGPASESEEMLKKLMLAGMNTARINFSHGGFAEQEEKINRIKKVRKELGLPVALLLDTKGPEIRIGKFKEGQIFINEGDQITLTTEDILGDEKEFSVTYQELPEEVVPGDVILFDDGLLEVRVDHVEGRKVVCNVVSGGKLSNRKGVNIPGKKLKLPTMTEKDKEDIVNGVKAGFDYIAASFIRSAKDVNEIRNLLKENGGEKIKIISKIENQEGVDNFDEILDASDGIMVARGDLSVEIPMARVPAIQKEFIRKTYLQGKVVITATQMLESMINNPRPTRAEVSDISNAIFDATSAIMLSGESATGKYPVECVELMSDIARETEQSINYWKRFQARDYDLANKEYRSNIYHGIVTSAMHLNAKAIIAYTGTGDTAGILSSFCPTCPIYAVTRDSQLVRQMNLEFNVYPRLIKEDMSIDDMIQFEVEKLKEEGLVGEGDTIIVAGGAEILPDLKGAKTNRVIGGIIQL